MQMETKWWVRFRLLCSCPLRRPFLGFQPQPQPQAQALPLPLLLPQKKVFVVHLLLSGPLNKGCARCAGSRECITDAADVIM
jgi:hypothetical protein